MGSMRSFACLLSALLLAACAGCAGQATAVPAQAAAERPVDGTLARLRSLAADRACTDDSQCHTLPLGASACGGPEGYLPWSSANTSSDALRALGERYQAERRAANAASGRAGACRFSPDPGAVCRAGACQLGTPGFQVQ
jgi:hypothetical protein